MKSDLDHLMDENNLDALLIAGSAGHNAAMTYFTGLAHLTHGYLIKKRNQEPILLHPAMERDEAARTGLQLKSLNEYDFLSLLKEADGDHVRATSNLLKQFLVDHDVSGRVALYGKVELGGLFSALRMLDEAMPEIELLGEAAITSTIRKARATKDADEVERIRAMGRITTAVIGEVAEFLVSHDVRDGVLVTEDGEALTVGDVKKRINLWLAVRGAENPHETIFAIGRDAGVPHSTGTSGDRLELGKTIVFDIFPAEAGGGYFYDITRTWSLGYATDEALKVYEDVLEVYEKVSAAMVPGKPCRDIQIMTCELFEEMGHPTVLSNPKTEEGYVHSLGHGLGLDLHESPAFSQAESNTDLLLPGSVVTVEPGLYYPDRGIGVRIEDSTWMGSDGKLEILADYPKDFVLKMRSS
jgi:Xaa-Pro aminopeptidase